MDELAVYDARIELIDFLIDVFWDVPDEEFVAALLGDDVALPDAEINESLDDGFAELQEFVRRNEDRSVEAVYDGLEVEYTRVFVGPRPPVLAHETYYREDTEFIGEGLAEVEASYGAAGWNPPEEYGEESDFVAVELAFLRHLVDRQRAGAEEAFGYERVFFDEHLLTWSDAFVEDLLDETDEPLFRAAALIFGGLVEFDDELAAQMV